MTPTAGWWFNVCHTLPDTKRTFSSLLGAYKIENSSDKGMKHALLKQEAEVFATSKG